jgi:hypothetical protein
MITEMLVDEVCFHQQRAEPVLTWMGGRDFKKSRFLLITRDLSLFISSSRLRQRGNVIITLFLNGKRPCFLWAQKFWVRCCSSVVIVLACARVFRNFKTTSLQMSCLLHAIVSAWELLVNWSGTLPSFKRVSNTLWHLFCKQVPCPPNGPSGHQYLHLDASPI